MGGGWWEHGVGWVGQSGVEVMSLQAAVAVATCNELQIELLLLRLGHNISIMNIKYEKQGGGIPETETESWRGEREKQHLQIERNATKDTFQLICSLSLLWPHSYILHFSI